jgi:PAS domain S-box-containing protein
VQGRVLLATLPVGAALIAQFILWPLIDPFAWFLFFPAVAMGAWIGGLAGGVAGTMLATLSVWYCFIPPHYSFAIHDLRHIFPMLMFAATGVAMGLFAERLRRSEQKAASLYTKAPDGIFVADMDGRYIDANEAACRMLGFTRAEIVGKTVLDLIDPADAPRLRAARDRQLQGDTESGFWRLRRQDGSFLLTEITAKI